MSSSITTLKDKLARAHSAMRTARDGAKAIATEMICTTVGAGVSAGLALLDESKGEVREGNLTGIRYHSVGPVPTALIVGGIGKIGGLILMGDSIAPIVSTAGQAGVDVGSYLATRQAYASWRRDHPEK